MLSRLVLIGILAITCHLAEPAYGDAVEYTADKWHTRIFFEVRSGALVDYVGMFHDFDIEFEYDEEDISNSSVRVVIPVSSFETFHDGLSKKLQQAQFFDVENYPAIEFQSTKVVRTSRNTARLSGDLTMHGVTAPMSLDVTLNGSSPHQRYKKNVVGFSARGTLDRHDFDLHLLPVTMVSSVVKIRIEMSAFEGESVPYYDKDD
jgi:polyisoprenoid-binding protein YceI